MEEETTFSVQYFWYSRVLPLQELPQEVKKEEDFILIVERRFLRAKKAGITVYIEVGPTPKKQTITPERRHRGRYT